jgi:uncharacterized protein YdaT
LQRLDELYPKVREYLRDHPKNALNVETLSEQMNVNIRDIQAMVEMGYLDRDLDRVADREALNKQKLAKEFEASLQQMKNASTFRDAAKGAASYGQQRHGEKEKKESKRSPF